LTGRKRKALVAAFMVGGVAAAVMYGLLDPARHALFPKCPFLMLTGGLRCPGCGSQRAVHALLHLEFKEAFLYNPMVVISIPFLVLLALAAITKDSSPKLYEKVNSGLLTKILLVIILGWWMFRNIAGL
jgi:uncharacterized integral membrane protein